MNQSFSFPMDRGPLAFLLEPVQAAFDLGVAVQRLRTVAAQGLDLDGWWPCLDKWVVMARTNAMDSSKPVAVKGRTAAQVVIESGGDLRWLRALQMAGADIHAQDEAGQPSIGVAVRLQSIEAVDVLLALGADIEARGESGRQLRRGRPESYTPLMIAAMNDDAAMCQALVQRTAQREARTDAPRSETALHVAISAKACNATRALLEMGCNAEVLDGNKYNPLYRSVVSDEPALMLALLEHGARPVAVVFGFAEPLGELEQLCARPAMEQAWLVHCASQAARAAQQEIAAAPRVAAGRGK